MGRTHKPVVRLSRLDQERLDRGDVRDEAEAVVDALSAPEGTAVTGSSEIQARNANEQRLLEDVPPHFGKL